jgi:predicted RNase H-like HicB family nuclease
MNTPGTLDLFAIVRKEAGLYVASCAEFDVESQGQSVEEALKNLKEALGLLLEDEAVDLSSL